MGSLIAIWRIVVRRAFANWKLLGVLGLGVLVAATLLASAPIYARTMNDLGLTYAIREDLPAGPGTRVLIRDLPVDDHGNAVRDSVDERIEDRIGWFTEDVEHFDRLGALSIAPPGETPVQGGPGGYLQSVTSYEHHVTVVEGRLPEIPAPGEPIEVAIHLEGAATAGLELGERFFLHERIDDCEQFIIPGDMPSLSPCPAGTPTHHLRFSVEAEVVGFIEPSDENDPFWIGGLNPYFGILRDLPATGPWVPLWVAPGTLSGPFARQFPGYALDSAWNAFADELAINRANYQRARDDIVALRGELERVDALSSSPLVQLLNRVEREQDYRQTPLIVLLLQVSAIALFYVALVSSIVVERQAGEIALLRSRGASLRQVLTVYFFEGLIIGVPVLLAAPFLAAAATALIGLLPVFEPVSGGDLLPVAIPPLAFGLAGLGVVLSLAALAAPAFIVARRSSVTQRRAETRPVQPFFQRYFLDLLLAGFAGLLLWELSERGSAFEPSPTGGLTSDPVLLASPALIIIAAAALILRFYPLLLRFVARLVTPSAGVSTAGALWQVVRSPGQYTRLALLVMMAIAIGTFAASYSTTADRSYRDRADFQVGVDVRAIEADRTAMRGPVAENEAPLHTLPGVERASLAHRETIHVGTTGTQSRPVQMLAIDAEAGADMLYFRDDFADGTLESLLLPLQAQPAYEGLPIPEGTTQLSLRINPEEARPDVTLWAQIRDAGGRIGLFEFGKLEETGWVEKRAELQQRGRTAEEPLSLLGIVFTEPPNRFNTLQAPLFFEDLSAVDAAGNVTSLDSFEGDTNWSTYPSLEQNRDEFAISSEDTPGGELMGRFDFRIGIQQERRGIYSHDASVPLVALASNGLLAQTGASVGSTLHMRVGDMLVPTRIVGSYDLFPTLSALEGPSMIYNRDQLISWAHITPREMWFSLEEGAASAPLVSALGERPFNVFRVHNRARELERVEQNPLIAAGGSGILQLSFVAVLVLVAAALLLSLWTGVQRRRVEFAIMRAMGVSRGQIFRQLAIEYSFVAILGIIVGAYLGTLVARQMLSFLDVTERGQPVEPSFILQTDWAFVAAGGLAVLAVFAVALVVAVRVLGRTADAQALRTE